MITTVTLNVSVDKAYYIKGIVVPGTVARVQKCVNSAGGKGLNVSRIIDFCGEEVLATGFAGGFNGAYVEDMLKKDGIPSRFTKTQSETRSCINILAEDESSTEYLEPGAPVSEEEIQQFLEDFDRIVDESDIITISGSIPAGVQKDIYATLVKMIKNKGKKVILDTSGDYLKEGIKAGPTMIKPNDEELEALLGIKIENRYQTIDAAKEMREKYGIEYVVVSLGGDGALVVCEEGIFHGKPPKLKAVNTVGCGDSMIAGFALGLSEGLSLEETLRRASAISAAAAMREETGFFVMEDMEKLLPQIAIQRL